MGQINTPRSPMGARAFNPLLRWGLNPVLMDAHRAKQAVTITRLCVRSEARARPSRLGGNNPSVYFRSEVRSLKTLWVRVSGIPQILLAVCLFLCASLQTFPATALGTQCPTASVQTIDVAIKDCCGKVIGHIHRAPMAGEKGFLQCRCAEKKAPKQESSTAPKFEVFASEPVRLEFPTAIPAVTQPIGYAVAESSADRTPPTPPPVAA